MCCQNNEEVIAVAAAEQDRESGEVVAEHSGAAVHRPEPVARRECTGPYGLR
jgi:hypothetical protein